MKKQNNYYIGLDLGTNSVGWAVTNEKYELLHLKRKPAIGVNTFEKAKTAEQRRNYRSTRRRLARRKQRVLLLQTFFAEEVAKKDPTFFLRLNNSPYFKEDKHHSLQDTKFSLFNDKDFTDKDFHKKYKTIYHLQNDIISQPDKKFDIRLVYLAVHHLIKYRGNFIKQDENINVAQFTNSLVTDAFQELAHYFEDTDLIAAQNFFVNENVRKYEAIVSDKTNGGLKRATDKIFEQFEIKDKTLKTLLSLALGKVTRLNQIFSDEIVDDEQGKITIDFKSISYEEKYNDIKTVIGEVNIVLIDELKRLYDYFVISRLMDGKTLVAEAMVEKYEKHRSDLALLKKIFREHASKEDYRKVFTTLYTTDDKGKKKVITDVNYPRYIGKKSPYVIVKKGDYADFKKFLNKMFKDLGLLSLNDVIKVQEGLDDETFLPLINSKDNATIPYQFNEYQLRLILENQSKYYKFLNEKVDESSLTTLEKIMSIISFKIPYYIGPLVAEDNHPFAWVKRKSFEKVTPWNFSDVIDEATSASRFIERMTNKCTYIPTEDVLPREAILYQEYLALDVLNNLKINGEAIDNYAKQTLLTALYSNKTPLTKKRIATILAKNKNDVVAVSGIDDDVKLAFTSLHKFKAILGENQDLTIEDMEKIIFYRTIFTEQKMFNKKVDELLGHRLSEELCKKIKQLKFKEWSRFSNAFLTGFSKTLNKPVLFDEKTGEVISIIDIMRNNVLSLQQVIHHEKYGVLEALNKYNESMKTNENAFEDVYNLYLSPSVKRPVIKAIHLVDEIIKANDNKLPKKIFLEVTRHDDFARKGTKTISRKKQLDDLYKIAVKESKDLKDLMDELNKKTDADLRSRKLYLYFLQHGKCLYTGNPIALENLVMGDYDIEHIIPQSLITDDSLNNICLVESNINKAKGDVYPLPRTIVNVEKMKPFWERLMKRGFMSESKYQRLIRMSELTEEERFSFINRQLVETSQANKAVAKILEDRYGKGSVVYSKAQRVSDFRHKFKLLKQRDLNKAHHAHDAYLNIVVGNYNDAQTRLAYINKQTGKNFKFNPATAFEEKSFLDVWDKKSNLATIKAVLSRKNILFTQGTYISKGEFYDQQLSPAGEGKLTPVKESGPLSDTTKYGGYSSLNTSHFALVEIPKKRGSERRLIQVTRLHFAKIASGKMTLEEYLITYVGLENPKVIIDVIPLNSLIKRGKTIRSISAFDSGNTLIAHNHQEPFFSKDIEDSYYYLNRYLREIELREKEDTELLTSNEPYTIIIGNRNEKEKVQKIVISKESNEKTYLELAMHFAKDIYEHIFRGVNDTLLSNLDNFKTKSIYEQANIIKQLVMLLQTGALPASINLTSVGLNKSINRNRNINLIEKGDKLLIQSITGLYDKEICLA